jgi:3-phenylpropionate/cinnamic acid dioxygenase small subunit
MINGLDKTEKVAPLDSGATWVIATEENVFSWQREEETALIERTNQGRLSHRLTRINTDEGKERTL